MALNFANNNSLSAITTQPSGLSGSAMTLLSTQTASSSATISFTSGIDSTYDEYVFKFYDIHPATNDVTFQVNFRDGGTDYDATKTTTNFFAANYENDSGTGFAYRSGNDVSQGTGVAQLAPASIGNGNDESVSGSMILFSPSSTTFVKHFISVCNAYNASDLSNQEFCAGYCNVTTAIDGVQFSFSSGNIDSGVIKLYGIS